MKRIYCVSPDDHGLGYKPHKTLQAALKYACAMLVREFEKLRTAEHMEEREVRFWVQVMDEDDMKLAGCE
jgi:hypothetical protein